MLLIAAMSIGMSARAQTETKVKATSTVGQRVHNTFSKHKHHKGYKVKQEGPRHKRKTTVNYRKGKTTVKKD